ncbi:hypothetical protein HYALB_00001061 [Hymenoscyphus albidus]|uniref:Extracellular membrane protein CFEM domain-containing protein n=1 Tax=Hymenoscyphus albidus TaxID=595503 RepID=A0A9N9M154_9HELO|nr:hypothetical protein HYALB_00001061 [Hymenoscyphus albidus]
MRYSFITTGFLAAASAVSAADNRCGQLSVKELVASNPCGDQAQISECLNKVNVLKLDEVFPCFVDSGCSEHDATFFVAGCTSTHASPRPDLKRNEAIPTGNGGKRAEVMPRQAQTTAAPTGAAQPVGAKDGPGPLTNCSTTYTTSVEVCVTSTNTAGLVVGSQCSQGAITTSSCHPAMICFADASDNALRVCMIRKDDLSTGGLVVSLAFSIALVGTIGSLFAMSRIEKSKAKREARERAALLGGDKSAMEDVETAKPYRIGGGGESNDNEADISSIPSNAPKIKLHKGIDGLEQQGGAGGQHWSNDYAAQGGAGNRL